MLWNQPIPACLAAGKDAYPALFGGSVVGQSTNAGHKKLEGKRIFDSYAKSYIYAYAYYLHDKVTSSLLRFNVFLWTLCTQAWLSNPRDIVQCVSVKRRGFKVHI